MNQEIYLIIKKDFDNSENYNPIKETVIGYVKNEIKVQSIIEDLSKSETYTGWDNRVYPTYRYIKVEEYK